MAEEAQYSSDLGSHKRKYDEPTPPPSARRPTGFSSAPVPSASPDSGPTPPPLPADMQQVLDAKQKAQEVASRLLFNASLGGAAGAGAGAGVAAGVGGFDVKRTRVDNGGGFDSSYRDAKQALNSAPSSFPVSYSTYGQGSTKKIEVPNDRVGVIIGKGGETIKSLQNQSGAKIQVTRDMDTDPHAPTRVVELMGTAEQISRAEQLIKDVLAEAEAGGSGMGSRRVTSQTGADQFVMKVPNNKVGLVIGKGGETIKNMQNSTGARIQIIPLHLPPGDTSTERNIFIDGTAEQIEAAKQLVGEVISSENRMRSSGMSGGYHQGYQSRPSSNWGAPPMQQSGYGYGQPGAYPGAPHYNMSQAQYGNYPPQPTGGYSGWDNSGAPPSQPGGYYDYSQTQPASQQQQQAPPGGPTGSSDTSGYNYNQPPPAASYGYSQDGYGGYTHQSGYGQPPSYDQQQQSYNASSGYSTATNPTQEGAAHPTYGAQSDSSQAPPAQAGYSSAPPSYGMPPTSQPGYGSGYGAPPAQKPPAGAPPYGQSQSPSATAAGGYGQGGYPPYAQAPYGAQGGYGQHPPAYGGYSSSGAYAQPSSYSADGAATGGGGPPRGGYEATPPASQATPPASTGTKASPHT